MYQLLVYLSCSMLLVAAVTELPEETITTDAYSEFPEDYTLSELEEPSAEESDLMMVHKINWSVYDTPFGRQAREVHQPEQLADPASHSATEVESHAEKEQSSLPRDGNACPSSAERGLTSLIRKARPLLPAERLRNILANAREDGEVRELLQLLRSDQFKERVTRLHNTKEKGVLRDYVCQTLKLNHAYYLEHVRLLFNAQSSEPPSSPLPNRRKGVRGLLQDLRDAVPRAQLRELYRRQFASDKDLSEAVRRIRGTEFRRLLSNVRALPEYRAVRDDLQKAGVPLQQVLNLVATSLGSPTLDLGSETEILSG
ncbi:uncharacterized protein [Drosophila virilis]|uniref:Uncharacterized protein n=1 Tax=Drosophila virilis TaxID=7244 RepID=B4LRN5_DROVI|nr:uncharacterized protein LOC6628282 [Drosophila virilis]EDW63630.1 uncharacterized protein Dvir_GJ15876 [Drosophila virilis]